MLGGCVYSTEDRASELKNATPTPLPTNVPEATPNSSGDGTGSEDQPDAPDGEPGTPAAAPGWVVVENVNVRLNVRSGPGTDNEVITQADLGTTLATTGQRAEEGDSTWIEVVVDDGATGWVHSGFVSPTAQPTPTPLSTPTPLATPTPAAEGDNLIVDAPLGLRLRAGPSVDAAVIRSIDDGAVVTPTGASSEDDEERLWVEIVDGDDTGWVAAAFLRSP